MSDEATSAGHARLGYNSADAALRQALDQIARDPRPYIAPTPVPPRLWTVGRVVAAVRRRLGV